MSQLEEPELNDDGTSDLLLLRTTGGDLQGFGVSIRCAPADGSGSPQMENAHLPTTPSMSASACSISRGLQQRHRVNTLRKYDLILFG